MLGNPLDIARRKTRIATAILVASCILAAASTARADLGKPSNRDALRLYTEGNTHYKVKEFSPAIERYKESLKIEESEACLYNIAQAYRQRAGVSGAAETQWREDYENSIWFYKRLLAVAKLTKADRVKVEGFISDMQAELDKQAATKPPTDTAEDADADSSAQGEEQTAVVMPKEEGSPAPSVGRRSPSTFTPLRKAALTVGGGGVLAVGVGVLFGFRASDLRDEAAALCPTTTCEDAEAANRLISRADSNARTANLAYGVGAVAIVGAAVLWFLGAPDDQDDATVSAVPRVARDVVAIDITLTF
jgi:tetratricopeptide (TPR) repeat protein